MSNKRQTDRQVIDQLRQVVAFVQGASTRVDKLAALGRAYVMEPARTKLRALTPEQVQQLKHETDTFLRIVGGKTESVAAARVRVDIVPVKAGGVVSLLVDGEPRDVLLYQIGSLLTLIGIERLKVCSAPDCRRPFLKVGRREYCSTRCQRRVFLRDYDPFAAKARREAHRGHTKTR